jgi:cell division protease FtsH
VLGRNQDLPFLGREMASEPDYSEEIAREIDDEIRRVIEEAHTRARQVLEQHMDELHRLSAILVERETIDKDQFLRLLDGAPEEEVFPEEAAPETEEPKADERRKRVPKPKPFPLPGQAMQPPDPEGAKG